MAMSEEAKNKLRKILKQFKDNIENVKDSLGTISDAKEARKQLRDAEFSILAAMYEISWIGFEREKAEEEVLSYTADDNPSAK